MGKRVDILSVNIIRFGKIKNLKLDFCVGFNVIYGFNEAGKSTIMRFIKAMFYGIPARRKSGEVLKERELAIPWDEKSAEGVLTISYNGSEIEIRRTFGNSAAEDSIYVSDLKTGNKLDFLNVNNIGKILFGVSEDIFLRTVMINQDDVFMGGKSEEITEKLMNIKSSGNEKISVDSALERLTDKANALKREDGRHSLGKIDELKRKKELLVREKYDLKTQIQQVKKIDARCSAAKGELARVRDEIQKCETELKHCLESLRDTTDSTDALIYEYDKKISDLQSREDYIRCADLTKEICESARNYENELFDNKKQRIVPYIIAAATAILGIIGVVFLLFGTVKASAYRMLAICVVLIIAEVCLIKFRSLKASNKIGGDSGNNSEKLSKILNRYSVKNSDELMQMYIETKSIKDTLDTLFKMKDAATSRKSVNKKERSSVSVSVMQDSIKALRNDEIKLVSEIKGLESRMAYEVKIERLPSDIETEINAINDEIRRAEKKYMELILAKAIIMKASENMKTNFIPILNKRTTEILNRIKIDNKEQIRISDEFYTFFENGAKLRRAEFFSKGGFEQLYFAIRYALSEIICLNSPFFADDILSVYDDKRADSALRFMSEQTERQMFLFTCKGFEAENAKELGADLIYIN